MKASLPGDEDGVSLAASSSLAINVSGTGLDKYPAKQHARRVAAQLDVEHGLVYLMGQRARLLEDSDQNVPFRQRRYFFYLSGVVEADCHLTYDIAADLLTLYVPDFDRRRAIWMGPTLGREQALDKYDFDDVKYYSALDDDISRWALKYNDCFPVYILHEDQAPFSLLPGHVDDGGVLWTDHSALQPAVDACRVIKDDHEVSLIRRANDVSAAAHTAVLRGIESMANEAEIHGRFLDTCVSHGARNQAYEIIAASGANAATLHYTRNDEPLCGRPLVCLDAGAEWDCYASDVTRTFPLTSDSWPSEQARNIYEAVLRMQETCISRIKAGVRYLDLHWLAHDIAIQELLRLGIFREGFTVREIRQSGASLVFFPHGLGHHVGLEVHDVSPESLMANDSRLTTTAPSAVATTPPRTSTELTTCHEIEEASKTYLSPCTSSAPALKAGMVVTVEPGIYFSRLALEYARSKPQVAKYIDMELVKLYLPLGGVRIEDDILVTDCGFVNLTTAPKGQDMLDVIGAGK